MNRVYCEGLGEVEFVDWSQLPLPWCAEAWPIALVVIWIAWRHKVKVEREWQKIVRSNVILLDQSKVDNQVIALRDAVEELWSNLRASKTVGIAAFCEDEDELIIPPHRWTSDLRFSAIYYGTLIYNVEPHSLHYIFVTVPCARVLELWPEILSDDTSTDRSPQFNVLTKRRSGRPQTEQGLKAEKIIREIADGDLQKWSGEALASLLGLKRTRAEEYRKQEIARRAAIQLPTISD